MDRDVVTALSDEDLGQLLSWVKQELEVRAGRRKAAAIAKIRELAGAAGVSVAIGGARGRPPGRKDPAKKRASG